MREILERFCIETHDYAVSKVGNGLINETYLIKSKKDEYILQELNLSVFKKPENIINNIRKVSKYISVNYPAYRFLEYIPEKSRGEWAIKMEGKYWRMSPFYGHTYTLNTIQKPEQAYQAAEAFGHLTCVLDKFPVQKLKVTIPNFHDLNLRFKQFLKAESKANPVRLEKAADARKQIYLNQHIVSRFQEIISNPDIPLRVIHHDTKINNVLFDKDTDKAVYVIDLDTLMPGRLLSDLGDMLRTYLPNEDENYPKIDKLKLSKENLVATLEGYLFQIKKILHPCERKHLYFSGEVMTFMQALRFLTDYLQNDTYYTAAYPEHNLIRSLNQLKVMKLYQELEPFIESEIDRILEHT